MTQVMLRRCPQLTLLCCTRALGERHTPISPGVFPCLARSIPWPISAVLNTEAALSLGSQIPLLVAPNYLPVLVWTERSASSCFHCFKANASPYFHILTCLIKVVLWDELCCRRRVRLHVLHNLGLVLRALATAGLGHHEYRALRQP